MKRTPLKEEYFIGSAFRTMAPSRYRLATNDISIEIDFTTSMIAVYAAPQYKNLVTKTEDFTIEKLRAIYNCFNNYNENPAEGVETITNDLPINRLVLDNDASIIDKILAHVKYEKDFFFANQQAAFEEVIEYLENYDSTLSKAGTDITKAQLLKLPLHEFVPIDTDRGLMRVLGGWVYYVLVGGTDGLSASSVFVPEPTKPNPPISN